MTPWPRLVAAIALVTASDSLEFPINGLEVLKWGRRWEGAENFHEEKNLPAGLVRLSEVACQQILG